MIMKKMLLFILLLIAALYAEAQCTQPYKAFNQFANDTTAFLRYNFSTRADCYKGKTVADVLRDLQLTPQSFVTLPSTRVNKYEGISIHVDNSTILERLQNPSKAMKKTQEIYIYWPDLMDDTEKTKLIRKYKDTDAWVQEYYDFFKNMIVGEVQY